MQEEIETSKTVTKIEESKKTSGESFQAKPKKGDKPLGVWRSILSVWVSRKLWMTVFSTLIIYGTYWHSVNHLYSFDRPEQISALSTMYIAMLSVLGVIVATYLGTNAIQSHFGISSAAQFIGQALVEKKEEVKNLTENINKKEEIINVNLSEHVVIQGEGNAPEVRPFSARASEE